MVTNYRQTFPLRTTAHARIPGKDDFRRGFSDQEFPGGWFTKKVNPFKSIKAKHNTGAFLEELSTQIQGLERLYTLHVIGELPELQARFIDDLDLEQKKKFYAIIKDRATHLNPGRALDFLKIEPWGLSRTLTLHFGFHFRKACEEAELLAWAMDFDGRHDIPPNRAEVLKRSPETLCRLANIYDTSHLYLLENKLESANNYPETAEKLKKPLHKFAEKMLDDLIKRGWRSADEKIEDIITSTTNLGRARA